MEDATHESAMATVFSIPELREAILIEYALLHHRDWHCDTLHHQGPILELFPLQRINHAFATTIRESPEIRRFMCGADSTSPVYHILSNIRLYRRWAGWRTPREPGNGRRAVYTDQRGELCFKWMMPGHWTGEEASWSNIKVFLQNHDRQSFELTHPFRGIAQTTLGTAFEAGGELVREDEPGMCDDEPKQVGMNTAEVDAAVLKRRNMPAHNGCAMSTVFGIAELREAILVEFALIHKQDQLRKASADHPTGPILQLFPLQRVCHSFTVTIRKSPQLRSLMCLTSGADFTSPLDWFLSTRHMSRTKYYRTRELEIREEHFEIRTNITDESEPRWLLPEPWKNADASWRAMKIFAEEHVTSDMRLDIMADPFGDEFEYGPLDPIKTAILKRGDDLTLGTFHELIEEVVREVEPRLRSAQLRRDEQAAEYAAESNRLRIAYYGEEINAMYPRGSTPPPVREEYRIRHQAQRREAGRGFSGWRRAQRQREYEAELREHRSVCEYCGEFDLDEG